MHQITKALLAAALAAALMPHAAAARDITVNDLVGRWCGNPVNYTFSRTDMIVTPLGNWKLNHAPHWVINKAEAQGNRIKVFWEPAADHMTTTFELSRDKRTLTQPSQSTGDKGPQRVFHRC